MATVEEITQSHLTESFRVKVMVFGQWSCRYKINVDMLHGHRYVCGLFDAYLQSNQVKGIYFKIK